MSYHNQHGKKKEKYDKREDKNRQPLIRLHRVGGHMVLLKNYLIRVKSLSLN